MLEITKENYDKEVLESEVPVLLDFSATWCGPCRMVTGALEEIAKERTDIKVVKVDVDDMGDLATQYNVTGIPALVWVKSGKEVARSVGAAPKSKILELIDSK